MANLNVEISQSSRGKKSHGTIFNLVNLLLSKSLILFLCANFLPWNPVWKQRKTYWTPGWAKYFHILHITLVHPSNNYHRLINEGTWRSSWKTELSLFGTKEFWNSCIRDVFDDIMKKLLMDFKMFALVQSYLLIPCSMNCLRYPPICGRVKAKAITLGRADGSGVLWLFVTLHRTRPGWGQLCENDFCTQLRSQAPLQWIPCHWDHPHRCSHL